MSEEVVIVSEVQSGTFFVLTLDSTVALLDKENARGLRDDLNKFLGADKQPGYVVTGITFPSGCAEPDLPVGTRFVDNTEEKDIVIKTGPSKYKWLTKWGAPVDTSIEYDWEFFNETWDLTVIA